MDTQILDQIITILQPVAAAGGAIATEVAASALWAWLKAKFKARSPAAIEAVTDIEKAPQNSANWEVFRAQLAKAIAEDENFRKELMQRLDREFSLKIDQVANVTGSHNQANQIIGTGNTINNQ